MVRRIYQVKRGCTFCGTCVPMCPNKAINFTETGAAINPAACTGCGVCVKNCASEAITSAETDNELKANTKLRKG